MAEKMINGRATHEVEVVISGDAYELLEELAESTGKSIPDVLKDALALEKWRVEAKKEDGRLLVELKDGQLRELVRP
jgi:biotin operon repressor